MHRVIRPYIAVLLALMLAFTGQSMAVARGEGTARGSVILCTGAGAIMVDTDAQGQPVGPPHICPEGALSLIVALTLSESVAVQPTGRAVPLDVLLITHPKPAENIAPSARAPPLLV